MKNADRVLKALKKDKQTITEIARFLSLHPSTVGDCIGFLKTQHPITERQEGLRKYFRLPKQPLPLSTGPGDPWGHLKVWGQDQCDRPPVKSYCGGVANYCTPETRDNLSWVAKEKNT